MSEEQSHKNGAPAAAEPEELMTLAEAVDFLGTSRPTMYRWLERGELKGLKVGKQWRFRRADLVAYLERDPIAAAAPAEELAAETAFFAAELEAAGVTPVDTEDEASTAEAKIELLAQHMIRLAIHRGASDIHLEPVRLEGEPYVLLRIRINGRLEEIRRLPIALLEALTLHCKQAAGMDPNERRLPQAGRLPFTHREKHFDLRLACLPTLFGEGLVMRILDRSNSTILGLEKLGLYPEELERLLGLLRQPNGLVLAAGPTGSGRSTLLYSGLQAIAGLHLRAYALEEHVEHLLPHVTPIRIDRRGGLSMALAARALGRNDPDVVLLGEQPDLETAQIMQSMALTGHLVLAQVYARSAAEGVRSFIDMGIDPHILGATVIGIVGMRLGRRICALCKEQIEVSWSDPLLEHWRVLAAVGGYVVPEGAPLYRGRGCEKCRNTGYRGRIGLYEVLVADEAIFEAIARDAPAEELNELAVANGMRTLVADGVRKMVDGQTTLEEVRRVTAAGTWL